MHMDAHGLKTTETIIGAAFEVANVLGAGFLEKIYERAMIHELEMRGLKVEAQVPLPVWYKADVWGSIWPISLSRTTQSWSSSASTTSPTSIWPNASTT